ncbi:tetratricopeptide repeat protein [Aetokthonos hydrillicola Thurmond2011]|uniref:Tetratricopeptide repeat protein n=1 Tax=Aetokthonos hydrillicola Thurmond2011 TaxID=2712845 RepID=A0AAP5MDB3_9CYAN|nr:Sll0314/Alr1548 family TPR repeat-containing protein [Aetokthonos hydrillicola]MBO3462820.1 tetratricopeptide repeat protein [Aetokthonos hydrillicola CCALA 1050]MBW4591018.1 tetratricopeptide repeat protein [Aetokthonos hydrillicola CCALA 1050]MDR9900332.1 tetratricopeptide repeat protein [Aetokthonos hydrillicola Thurmond2011]
MTEYFSVRLPIVSTRLAKLSNIVLATAFALNITVSPSLGADPFRTSQPRKIGNQTEAAFKAIFQQGNYQAAERYVQQALLAEPNEPLAYAIKASLAYTNQDWATLDTYSKKTLETAQKLITSDPLRGNLYTAVGHFLEGAVILSRQGTVSGAPQALDHLRQVYESLDKAEAISSNDPEVNLLKGYMDLMIAVNLPFANPQQAIERLEKNAAPRYLVDRGIAIAYRDLKQYNQAIDYANRALKATSDNPELYYLKAQILKAQARKDKNQLLMQEAITDFDKALAKKSQLPNGLVKQIERERRNASVPPS